mgnify:CR=1 FL=1
MSTKLFWNNLYKDNPTLAPDEEDAILQASMQHFGDITGARLLDVGCGNGSTSLFFFFFFAKVVAIDISDAAIANLAQFCAENSIDNITPVKGRIHQPMQSLDDYLYRFPGFRKYSYIQHLLLSR